MAKNIIAALRRLPQLHGSTFLAALEIAHRASDQNGQCFLSYSLLAAKTHQSRRTAIRQVKRLVALGILRVQHFWQPGGHWGINRYIFCIRWEKPHAYPPPKGGGDSLAQTFPHPGSSSEKCGTIGKMAQAKHRASTWLTPGSQLWQLTQAIEVPG